MPKAPLQGTDLYYEAQGEGRETIVFAHGAGGNHLVWYQQVAYFVPRYRCVTFDHRMFGQSADASGEGYAAFVRDLEGLFDHLALDRAHLVAQSMGGRTCLPFAAAHPERVRRLVMADTTLGIADPAYVEALAAARAALQPPKTISVGGMAPDFATRDPAALFLYNQISGLNPPRPDSTGAPLVGGIQGDALARFAVPTLFIVGDQDDRFPAGMMREAQRLLPGSRLEVVRGAGHSVYFERPAVFNHLVDTFLNDTTAQER